MNLTISAMTAYMMWKVFRYNFEGTGENPKEIRQKD